MASQGASMQGESCKLSGFSNLIWTPTLILPRYIHDEMWGVSMDPEGNYLLLGGSGDEYSYSAESNGQVHTK